MEESHDALDWVDKGRQWFAKWVFRIMPPLALIFFYWELVMLWQEQPAIRGQILGLGTVIFLGAFCTAFMWYETWEKSKEKRKDS